MKPKIKKNKLSSVSTQQVFNKEDYGDNWPELSAACKRRDNYTCRNCGYNQHNSYEVRFLHADHIVPLTKKGPNKLSNLQTLCSLCHEIKTNRNRPPGMKVFFYTPRPKHKITRVKRFRPK